MRKNEYSNQRLSPKKAGKLNKVRGTARIPRTTLETSPTVTKTVEPNSENRPHVTITINCRKYQALVDTGSAKSYISEKVIHENRLTPNSQTSNTRARLANGTEVTISNNYTVRCKIQNFTDTVTLLHLTSLTSDIVIGMDLLNKWNANINVQTKKVTFKAPDLTYQAPSENQSIELASIQELTPSQKNILQKFLEKELPLFNDIHGPTDVLEHKIRLADDTPVKQRYRPRNPAMQAIVDRELNKMMAEGVVEPSNSPWSSPIVVVPKKNGESRFCVDLRQVNERSIKDSYPLPYISAILDKLRQARYITTLDLKNGYWQVPLHPDSRPITAFTVPGRGLFQFKVMPFGLHSAPATFQRLLDIIIGPDMEPIAFVYLDDIIVIGRTFEEHLANLEKVFERLRKAKLRINPDKCNFCCTELKYLGHVVNQEGIKTDPDKVQAIVQFEAPRNITELRRFLGIASWYRRFIPDFANTTASLTKLLRKRQPWYWDEAADAAFNQLKEALSNTPVLACPDFKKTFYLQTDSSDYGLGAALFQKDGDREQVIAYASRSLNPAERNYSTTEKECLAVVWAIQKLRHYIEGYHFKVITDHQALKWLNALKNPTGRLARWAIGLQQYDFEILYRKGSLNQVADALSRQPQEPAPTEEILQIDAPFTCPWYTNKFRKVTDDPDNFPDYCIQDGRLYRRIMDSSDLKEQTIDWKICVPSELRQQILSENHDEPTAGHLGITKTIGRLAVKYYWPGMFRDAKKYILKCDSCLRYKSSQQARAGQMYASDNPAPWQTVSSDFIGPLPRSKKGYNYLLVFQDRFTKWIECQPVRKATTAIVCQAFKERVLCRFGCPKKIITDNGPQFDSREFRKMVKDFRIEKIELAPYSPQNNPVERANKTLKTCIAQMCNNEHKNWDEKIPEIMFALNSSKHESTGFSPAFLNFGRELELPTNINELQTPNQKVPSINERVDTLQKALKIAKVMLGRAASNQQHYYNLRRRDWKPKIGERVYVKEHHLSSAAKGFAAKLAPKYAGPYPVTKIFSPVLVEVTDERGRRNRVHVKDLKKGPTQ